MQITAIKEPFNFNELPGLVRRLFERVENIEVMIHHFLPAGNDELDLMDLTQASAHLKGTPAALFNSL